MQVDDAAPEPGRSLKALSYVDAPVWQGFL
jgi:hypothetical protein